MVSKRSTPVDAFWLCVVLCIGVGLALRVYAWSLPIRELDALLLPDDAYISLDVARSIGLGLGPVSLGHFTNGIQPLYVLLMAPVYAVLGNASLSSQDTQEHALRIALALLVLCDLANLLLLAQLLHRLWGRSAGVLVALAAWAVSPVALSLALGGLETTLSVLTLLLLWGWYLRHSADTTQAVSLSAALQLGVLAGVGTLARIDVSIAAAWIALLTLRRSSRDNAKLALGAALGFALSYGPWLAYSWHYTGRLYPTSGQATRLQSFPLHPSAAELWHSARVAAHVCWSASWYIIVACGVALLALAQRRQLSALSSTLRPLAPLLLFGASLFVAYAFFQGGHWYFYRYLLPVHLAAILLFAAGAHTLLSQRNIDDARFTLPITLLALLLGAAPIDEWRATLRFTPGDEGYRTLALWVRDHVPAATVIGSGQTGALAYFAPSHHVVNLDGVVNDDALRAIRAGRLLDYVRDENVELVVGWPGNFAWMSTFKPAAGIELIKLGELPGFRTHRQPWLLYRVRR